MTKGTRYAIVVGLMILAVAAVMSASTYLAVHAVDEGNQRWCDTLALLTEHPVAKPADPQANPSREGQYEFYVDLVKLRGEFGCRLVLRRHVIARRRIPLWQLS